MELRGINRIIIAVKDLEKSKKFYTNVLGATFHEANWTGNPFGMDVAISWDAGIELCAPMSGREKDSVISPFLEQNGEGIINIVFGVSDADMIKEKAEAAGVASFHSLDYSQEEIDKHLGGLFKRYKEHFLDSSSQCGYSITLGQLDRK